MLLDVTDDFEFLIAHFYLSKSRRGCVAELKRKLVHTFVLVRASSLPCFGVSRLKSDVFAFGALPWTRPFLRHPD